MSLLKSILNKSWPILVALAICAITLVIVEKRGKLGGTSTVQVSNPLLLKQVDSFRDANGKLYAELENRVYTQAQVSHLLDSTAKVLRIKASQIKGIEKITTIVDTVWKTLPGQPQVLYGVKDTFYKIRHLDPWNDITAVAGKDTGSISFKSVDTLTRYQVHKSFLFKPDQDYIYINSANPYMQINQGASFLIKEKQPFLTIGPYIGYDPFSNRFSLGISIQKPIITIKK